MKKILIGITLVIIILVIFLSIGGKKNVNVNEDVVYKNTINISRTYTALRVRTNKILNEASEYSDYNTWNTEMMELINNWKNLEEKASNLEKQAKFLSEDKLSLKLINEVHAYSKDEISNVFDKAPAGKKIRTLAKYLGVDAKRAYKILQNDQEFVKADAWNEAGDTFKKLEASAIAIKDGCKVAAFVGAVAMTGGAAAGATVGSAGVGTALVAGSATTAQATVLVVTGTDLMLEIGEDAATIALGDNHKATKYISGIREYTEPAASILSLTDIPKNVVKGAKVVDKIGVILIQVDQARSMLQDGKLLGINIKSDSKIEVAPLKDNEVEKWMDEHKEIYIPSETNIGVGEGGESEEIKAGINGDKDGEEVTEDEEDESEEVDKIIEDVYDDLDEWLESFEDLDDWMEEFEDEENDETEVEEMIAEENEEKNDDNIVEKYIKEMQGQTMDEYKTLIKYAQEFEKLHAEGLINDEEHEELMKEANRLGEEKRQDNKSVQERETDILAENIKRRERIGKERGDITKMTTEEFIADSEAFTAKNEARRTWLRQECINIHGEGEEAEMCYYRGQ